MGALDIRMMTILLYLLWMLTHPWNKELSNYTTTQRTYHAPFKNIILPGGGTSCRYQSHHRCSSCNEKLTMTTTTFRMRAILC